MGLPLQASGTRPQVNSKLNKTEIRCLDTDLDLADRRVVSSLRFAECFQHESWEEALFRKIHPAPEIPISSTLMIVVLWTKCFVVVEV